MAMELRASDNRASAVAADQAIEGAARYVEYVLTNYATNGVMPTSPSIRRKMCRWRRALLDHRTGQQLSPGAPQSGDIRLGGRVIEAEPQHGPNQHSRDAAAGDSGRGQRDPRLAEPQQQLRDGTLLRDGATTLSTQRRPVRDRYEVRLVYGTTMDILVGDDLNRNGVLDPSEPDEDGNGQVDPGIIEYLTVYSREPNAHSDGTALTNINNPAQLRTLLQSNFGGGRATQILSRLFPTVGGTGTRTNAPARETAATLNGLLQFYLRSGLSETEFAEIYPDLAVGTTPYTPGRVNINTANVTVLSCLPGMDPGSAQQAVSYRAVQSPGPLGPSPGLWMRWEEAARRSRVWKVAITSPREVFSLRQTSRRWARMDVVIVGSNSFSTSVTARQGSSIDRTSPVSAGPSARMSARQCWARRRRDGLA